MALPALSGVIMHVSPCHPRSLIFATATAMPALILPASKPGGSDGSEKSTVSGFWPTKRMRVIGLLQSTGYSEGLEMRSATKVVAQVIAVAVEALARGAKQDSPGSHAISTPGTTP